MGSGASKHHAHSSLSMTGATIDEEEENFEITDLEVENDEDEEERLRADEAIYMSQLPLKEKLKYLELRRLFEEAESTGDAWTRRTQSFKSMSLDPSKSFSSPETKSETMNMETKSYPEPNVCPEPVSYEFVRSLNRTCIRTMDGKLIPLPRERHHPPKKAIDEDSTKTSSSMIKRGKQRLTVNTSTSSGHDIEHLSFVPTGNKSFRKSHPLSPCINSLFEKHKVKLVKKDRLAKKLDAHKQPLVMRLIPSLNNLRNEKFEEFSVQVYLTDSRFLRMNFATICECEVVTTDDSNGNIKIDRDLKKYSGKAFLHSFRAFSKAENTRLEIGDEILQIDNEVDICSISNQVDHDIDNDVNKVLIEHRIEEWQKVFDTKLNDSVQKKLEKAGAMNSSGVVVSIKARRYECMYKAIEKNVVTTTSRGHKDGMMMDSRDAAIIHINDAVARSDNILPF